MKRTLALFTLFAIASLAAACDRSPTPPKPEAKHSDPLIHPKDEALMDRAVAKARATQAQFVTALQSKGTRYRGFAIKKPFPVTGDATEGEHMWINEVTWDGKKFSGVVNNDAVKTKAVALGDHVTVTPEELSDWMYIDHGNLVGGYTLRVLHFESSPEEQAKFTEETGIKVPPIDF